MRRVKYLTGCLALVVLLSLLSGCVPGASNVPSSPIARPNYQSSPALPNIADVVEIVKPSVVAINTESVIIDALNGRQVQQGAGSGWILDVDGTIVTNNHVIDGATTITVTMVDGHVFNAEPARSDPLTDLAIIKISAGGLSAARIGDASRLRVGDWVVAIGNPLGFGISAKQGIVSRLGVPISVSAGQMLYDLIETSAAINPGNSGGPLANMSGEVIGITSYKIGTVGVEGMGYAININDAIPVIEELVSAGCVTRAWLGPSLQTVSPAIVRMYRLSVDKGALVTDVPSGSPAEKAGIKKNDVIVGFEGKDITTAIELTQAVSSSKIGQKVKITYWRGNSKSTVDAMLVESPPCKY